MRLLVGITDSGCAWARIIFHQNVLATFGWIGVERIGALKGGRYADYVTRKNLLVVM